MKKRYLYISILMLTALFVLPAFFSAASAGDCSPNKSSACARVKVFALSPERGEVKTGGKCDFSCSFSFRPKRRKASADNDLKSLLQPKDGAGAGIAPLLKQDDKCCEDCTCNGECKGNCKESCNCDCSTDKGKARRGRYSKSCSGDCAGNCHDKKAYHRKYRNRKHKKHAVNCCTDDKSCKENCLKPKNGCGKGIKPLLKQDDKCNDKKYNCKIDCKGKCDCNGNCCDKKDHQRKYRNRKHKNHAIKCCTEDKSCKEKCFKPKNGCGKGIKPLLKKDGKCSSRNAGIRKHHEKRSHQRKFKNRKLTKDASFIGKTSYIRTNQLKSLVFSDAGFVLIDARSPKYDNGERIPGAVNFHSHTPDSVIKSKIPDKLTLTVVYCSNLKCPASHKMYKRLQKMGYLAVHEYRYGIDHWKKMKLPVTKAQ